MARLWSLARVGVAALTTAGGIIWSVSGIMLWWLEVSYLWWELWLLTGVGVVLTVRVLAERWTRSIIVIPLEEIRSALATLSLERQPDVVLRRYRAAEIDALARSVEHLASRLHAVEESVDQLQKVRSQFLANVSHELRTPLFALEGYLETLLDGALDDPSVAKNFVEKALANLRRLSTLLSDLVEIARIESGEMRMSFRYFDITELARSVVQQFEEHARQQNMLLELVTPDSGLAYGDRDRIGQVLSNLISNAIKYNVPNGRVTVRVEPEDGHVCISVEDTGVGIPPEHQSRVFERFYRVDSARSRAVGGSGLGLAIVKHILEAHRAPYQLQSEVGAGTTIRFWLKT